MGIYLYKTITMLPESNYVMIIDDDIHLCHLLSTMLYTKNLNVVCAYSIREANDYMQRKEPSLVFLDNKLPDGTGLNYLARLTHDHPSVKVVMITGDATEETKEQALANGCMGFLDKPFSFLKVSELVDKALTVNH